MQTQAALWCGVTMAQVPKYIFAIKQNMNRCYKKEILWNCGQHTLNIAHQSSLRTISREILVSVNIDHTVGGCRDDVRSGCASGVQKHLVLSLLDRFSHLTRIWLEKTLGSDRKREQCLEKSWENLCTCVSYLIFSLFCHISNLSTGFHSLWINQEHTFLVRTHSFQLEFSHWHSVYSQG